MKSCPYLLHPQSKTTSFDVRKSELSHLSRRLLFAPHNVGRDDCSVIEVRRTLSPRPSLPKHAPSTANPSPHCRSAVHMGSDRQLLRVEEQAVQVAATSIARNDE
jgi:hypothetical protein